MGHILHDWDLAEKRKLLEKAFAALPKGGAVIVYDAVIDDELRLNVFGLLMSLNILIETRCGFDYTGARLPSLDARRRFGVHARRAVAGAGLDGDRLQARLNGDGNRIGHISGGATVPRLSHQRCWGFNSPPASSM